VNSRQPEAYANRGLVRLQQGKRSEADHDIERSLSLRPSLKPFIETRVAQISQR
jgi:Tfp pilus assembly protein PilF